MTRALNEKEIADLKQRHYWEWWAWSGPATVGQIIDDDVFGPVLASTDARGREWYIVGANPSVVAATRQPEYRQDPQYGQAIQAAIDWEIDMVKAAARGTKETAREIVKGAADVVEPLIDLTTPLLVTGLIVGGIWLLSQAPRRSR